MSKQNLPAEPLRLAEAYAVGFLRQGRAGWDEPHTRAGPALTARSCGK